MASLNQTIRDIERKHGAKIARAFSDAIADLRKSVVIGRVVEALAILKRLSGRLTLTNPLLHS